ncbi:MAG: DUF6285 domain-containing protein [Myxococcota bacterium]
MQHRPDHPTLLDALASFLMGDVAPKLEADKALQFRVLIAANLATVMAGEGRTHDARLAAEGARLQRLLDAPAPPRTAEELEALNRALAARLREGALMTPATLEHLLQTARETLEVTNPRFELAD